MMLLRSVCLGVFAVLAVLTIAVSPIFAATAQDISTTAQSSAEAVFNSIQGMHRHPLFLTVGAASIAAWLLGIAKGFNGSADLIKRYWRKPNPFVVLLLDIVIFAVGGAYIGTGIYNPKDFVPALAAGLTWPIAFAALTTRDARGQTRPPGQGPLGRATRPNRGEGTRPSNGGRNTKKTAKKKKAKKKKVAGKRVSKGH